MILIVICALSLGIASAQLHEVRFHGSFVERYMRNEGVPDELISHPDVQNFINRVERARSPDEVISAEREIAIKARSINFGVVSGQKFKRWSDFVTVMDRITYVMEWIVTFETNLAAIFNGFTAAVQAAQNFWNAVRYGFRRSMVEHEGDFRYVHRSFKGIILKQAAKYLSPDELITMQEEIALREKQEAKNMQLAYELTARDDKPIEPTYGKKKGSGRA